MKTLCLDKIAKKAHYANSGGFMGLTVGPERRMRILEKCAGKILGERIEGINLTKEQKKELVGKAAMELSKVPTYMDNYVSEYRIVAVDGVRVTPGEPSYATKNEMKNDWIQKLGNALHNAAESVLPAGLRSSTSKETKSM